MHAVADARAADAVVPVGVRVVPVGASWCQSCACGASWCQCGACGASWCQCGARVVLVVLDSTTVQGTVVGRVESAPALLKAVLDARPE